MLIIFFHIREGGFERHLVYFIILQYKILFSKHTPVLINFNMIYTNHQSMFSTYYLESAV